MKNRSRLFMAVLALALSACSSTPAATSGDTGTQGSGAESASDNVASGRPGGIGHFGGQTGGEAGIHCNADVELEPLAFDAVSPLGYSAAEIMNGLAPSYGATLSYADDRESALTVRLASDGHAAYAPGCSRVAIDVTVGWSSADGAFDEVLHGKLFALAPDAATLSVEVPASELMGDYARSHAAELVPAPVSFSFEIEFAPSEIHGNVSALRGPPDARDSLAIGSF